MCALRLPPLPTTGELLRLYKLRALKQLSQNFLLDPKLCSKLVRAAGRLRGATVCEVGPGPGNLTRAILEQGAARLTVVEKDTRFLPALDVLKEASGGALDVCVGDVLVFNMEKIFLSQVGSESFTSHAHSFDSIKRNFTPKVASSDNAMMSQSDLPSTTWEDPPPNAHIIGNLPFSIATPLLIRWLQDISLRRNAWMEGRTRMTLTYQLEVAQRMAAPPGHAQRCRLSLMCQNWCYVKHCFTIPGRAFVPPPDVDVGVVRLTPRVTPCVPLPFPLVEKVARCLFSFRQKYCRHGIGTLFPIGVRESLVDKMFKVADVDPTLRPFQITMPEFARLCHTYKLIVDQHPSLAKFNHRDPASEDMMDYDDILCASSN